MYLTIGNVLSQTDLEAAQTLIAQLDWEDGAKTAGARARGVKRNEQANLANPEGLKLVSLVRAALNTQAVFQAAARPRIISKLLLSRTQDGGGYGAHVDNALMGQAGAKFRSDLSFTLFLNDPDDYEGGELSIDFPGGAQTVKLPAGDMVLYQSSLIHEVLPVTKGHRLALVGWVESEIRDPFKREIMFDLDRIRLGFSSGTIADPERLLMDKVYSNLLRLWAGS
ncbi:MAG: Fe2+-dependent dioxygenase [Hyphomonadaceae bacterium]